MANDFLQKYEKSLRAVLSRHQEVALAYCFGSRARGDSGPASDYDFAIYFNLPPVVSHAEPDVVRRGNLLFSIGAEFSKLLNSDDIDIHSLNDLYSPELKYRIISQGTLIFQREPFRLIVEPKILNEYFDFMYLLKKYNLTKA